MFSESWKYLAVKGVQFQIMLKQVVMTIIKYGYFPQNLWNKECS